MVREQCFSLIYHFQDGWKLNLCGSGNDGIFVLISPLPYGSIITADLEGIITITKIWSIFRRVNIISDLTS